MQRLGNRSVLDILGTRITAFCSRDEFLQDLLSRPSAKVAFANTNLLNIAAQDRTIRDQLSDFLIVNDGIGVDLGAYIVSKARFPANLNGTDFIPFMLERLPASRIFLFGAKPEVLAAAANVVRDRYQQHEIVGAQHGYAGEDEKAGLAERIAAANADILLVALGNPLQEQWLSRHFEQSGCRYGFAVGALFDFLSGSKPRAPMLMQKLKLEWLFRLMIEPRRLLRRYTVDIGRFLIAALRQRSSVNPSILKETRNEFGHSSHSDAEPFSRP